MKGRYLDPRQLALESRLRRQLRRAVDNDTGRATDYCWRPDRHGLSPTIVERRRRRRYDPLTPGCWLRWHPVLIDDEGVLCHAWSPLQPAPEAWEVFHSGDGRRWIRPLSWCLIEDADYAVAFGPSRRSPSLDGRVC